MISVYLDHNEASRPRAKLIEAAVGRDSKHFVMEESESLPFDILVGEFGFVEVKDFTGEDNSDYLKSILSGHLYEQVLAAMEQGWPLVILVTGDDNDVGAAIRKAATVNHRVDPEKLLGYYRMVEGFEANCIALNIRVWRLKTDPYGRMLLRVRKIIEGGDLTSFAPHPAENERQVVAVSIVAGRGIGPIKARAILEKFEVVLKSKSGQRLEDCAGIGNKLGDMIRKNVNVSEGMR